MALNKRPNWEQIQLQLTKMPPTIQGNPNKRFPMKSLAELQQRKHEVISQLEKMLGKRVATVISNTACTQAKQESSPIGEFEGTPPYIFWTGTINSGPTFVRSDSILKVSKLKKLNKITNRANSANKWR